jgi:hypothetical protein
VCAAGGGGESRYLEKEVHDLGQRHDAVLGLERHLIELARLRVSACGRCGDGQWIVGERGVS